jgi:hypothetical protein
MHKLIGNFVSEHKRQDYSAKFECGMKLPKKLEKKSFNLKKIVSNHFCFTDAKKVFVKCFFERKLSQGRHL